MIATVNNKLPSGREVTLTVSREMVDVSTGPRSVVDPAWHVTDADGHEHDSSLETCEWVVTGSWWCDSCSDVHEDSELQCCECGEEIAPTYITLPPEREVIPGLSETRLTVTDHGVVTEYLLAHDVVIGADGVTDEWIDSVLATNPVVIGQGVVA